MSGKDEDFVEMISVIMVYGREWYDDMVQKTCFQNGKLVNETAYDAFTRKEAIVVDYLKNVGESSFMTTPREKASLPMCRRRSTNNSASREPYGQFK